MPQATDELREKWKTLEAAEKYLESRGWVLSSDGGWYWIGDHTPDLEELSAIEYCSQAWDYGGYDIRPVGSRFSARAFSRARASRADPDSDDAYDMLNEGEYDDDFR